MPATPDSEPPREEGERKAPNSCRRDTEAELKGQGTSWGETEKIAQSPCWVDEMLMAYMAAYRVKDISKQVSMDENVNMRSFSVCPQLFETAPRHLLQRQTRAPQNNPSVTQPYICASYKRNHQKWILLKVCGQPDDKQSARADGAEPERSSRLFSNCLRNGEENVSLRRITAFHRKLNFNANGKFSLHYADSRWSDCCFCQFIPVNVQC